MLAVSRYQFVGRTLDDMPLSAYSGSALRGVFGHALKQTVCITGQKECGNCPLRQQCAYTQLFETGLFTGQASDSPQPILIDAFNLQRFYREGSLFAIEMTLIGKSSLHLPYIVQAWRRAGQLGLGPARARFDVVAVRQFDVATGKVTTLMHHHAGEDELPNIDPVRNIRAQSMDIKVSLNTPYRSKANGSLVTPKTFCGRRFVRSLAARMSSLRKLHDPESVGWNHSLVLEAADCIETSDINLRWVEWQRRSSRQKTEMQMGGVVGVFQLGGDSLAVIYPLLELGQWVHAGKHALFGLGRYRISVAN